MSLQIDVARRFIDGRNRRELEPLLATTTPDVELYTKRGLATGADGIREWLERMSYGVAPYIVLERVYERGETVVAAVRGQLRFVDSDEPAEAGWQPGAVSFAFADGRIARVTMHADLSAALDQLGLGAADEIAAGA